jgi:hypothetical protein
MAQTLWGISRQCKGRADFFSMDCMSRDRGRERDGRSPAYFVVKFITPETVVIFRFTITFCEPFARALSS